MDNNSDCNDDDTSTQLFRSILNLWYSSTPEIQLNFQGNHNKQALPGGAWKSTKTMLMFWIKKKKNDDYASLSHTFSNLYLITQGGI